MNTQLHAIDFETWDRRQYFYYFTEMLPTGFNLNDQEQYSGNHGILAKPELPPPNSFMVGMLPWTQFSSYSPIPYGKADYYFPVLQKCSDLKMPLEFVFQWHFVGWVRG
ncbi:MAG: hypothetical protein PHO29_07805 [Acetobacterium sp.]|nr:hypothetical protein [Acetobacterium sp.]